MKPNGMKFSDDEQRVLEHFRPSAAGEWRRGAIFDFSFIIISLVLGAIYLVYRDPGAGFVAYALVFWRPWTAFWQRRRCANVYRSIFNKYESRVQQVGGTSANQPESLTSR